MAELNMPDIDNTEIEKQAEILAQKFETLQLATISNDGFPEISYAPFIAHNDCFYIFISELAAHTRNLLKQPIASVMLIEDEPAADNAFARKRLTYRCQARQVIRETPEFAEQANKMEQRFGAMIKLLTQLNDFHLFELKPVSGQYVAGFGKTYEIVYPQKIFRPVTQADINRQQ